MGGGVETSLLVSALGTSPTRLRMGGDRPLREGFRRVRCVRLSIERERAR